MSEKDIKIRRQWFGLLILNMLINSGGVFLQTWLNPAFNHIPQLRYVTFSISLISSMAFGYGLYRCIYKKPGTKLLTVCLIMTVACLVITPFLYLNVIAFFIFNAICYYI